MVGEVQEKFTSRKNAKQASSYLADDHYQLCSSDQPCERVPLFRDHWEASIVVVGSRRGWRDDGG